MLARRKPREVRDAILAVLAAHPHGASVQSIEQRVTQLIGESAASSVRSYLRLNTPSVFVRTARAHYALKATHGNVMAREAPAEYAVRPTFSFGQATIIKDDCLEWLRRREANSIHAVVTDPPYGLFEYTEEQQEKLRIGKGGCGAFRRPLTESGARHFPDSPCFRLKTCGIWRRFFSNGRRR
jgi:hypothetical protein